VRHSKSLLFAAFGMLAAAVVHAQAPAGYPAKPIKIVVPFAAGGSPDTFTRIVVKGLDPRLKQPLIIENRPGANSIVGLSYAAKQAPDGYSISISIGH